MEKKWWHGKIAYQIYPKSFCDTNGDGVGDLPGVIQKLDYLKALGVDIVWLSPIYPSPFVDQGYDIADYYGIDPLFGTMTDFDRLLAEAKRRDMGIVMDLVVNHCSDQHEWFKKALADPYGPYADYFYFRPGKAGGPPNNYRSYFGGSAWTPVPGTDLYYLHYFAAEQPDLNWENPKLRREIYDMVNWWLDKGLAGFRIDAIINVQKELSFADLPADGADGLSSVVHAVQRARGVEEKLQALKRNTFARYDAFTVGEVFDNKPGTLGQFIGDEGCFSSIFDFGGHSTTFGGHGWYDAPAFDWEKWKAITFARQAESDGVGFFSNIVENHDEPRGASRYLPDFAQNPTGQKLLGTVSVLLRGVPFLYQGQELGMTNLPTASIADYEDISTRNEYQVALAAGCTPEKALAVCQYHSRDNARTPMQWSAEANAGFTTGTPWFTVNPNYRQVNAAAQQSDPDSVLNYYKKLLALRKAPEWVQLFTYGATQPVDQETPGLFAYRRVADGRAVLVAANASQAAVQLDCGGQPGALLLSNMPDPPTLAGTQLTLRPLEAVVLALA